MTAPGRIPGGRGGAYPRAWFAVKTSAWLAVVAVTGWLVRAEVARPTLPAGVVARTDLAYGEEDGRALRLDVYTPSGSAPGGGFPAVLAVHGGGWRGGDKGEYGRSLLPLTGQGIAVVAVNYRLSKPGTPSWPGNLDDVRGAARWLRANGPRFGIDPDRIALLGASAGAHLALLAGLDGRDLGVKAVVDFYGPSDLRSLYDDGTRARTSLNLLFDGPPAERPGQYEAASPAGRVKPGAPPVLLLHGSDDLLIPPGQSERLVEALGRAGVEHRLLVLPGARHGFGLHVGGKELAPVVADFLRGVWGEFGPETSGKAAGP